MCKVSMDLRDENNLDFAIYSLVLSKKKEFSPEDLVSDVISYQQIDEEHLTTKVSVLLKRWVKSGVIQEHLDTFSVI